MTLLRVRRAAQVTLPADVRRALDVKEGDYLEAEVVKGGVLLKPVSIIDRERAWENVFTAAAEVTDLEPNPNEDPKAAEEWIAEQVKEHRRKKRRHA